MNLKYKIVKNNIFFVAVAALMLSSCEPVDENAPLNLDAHLTFKADGQLQKHDFSTAYIYDETYNSSSGSGYTLKLNAASGYNAFSIVINSPNKITTGTWYSNSPFYNTGTYFTFRNAAGNEYSSNKNPLGLPQFFKCIFTEITLNKGSRSRYDVKGNFEAVVYYQPAASTVEKLTFTEGEFTVSGSK